MGRAEQNAKGDASKDTGKGHHPAIWVGLVILITLSTTLAFSIK